MLKKILWVDFVLGSVAGVAGLLFVDFFANLFNLPADHLVIVSVITISYSVVAFGLAQQKNISILLLFIQINANWFWTIVSFGLLIFHFDNATKFGVIYLVLQILAVGVLAFLEQHQLQKIDILSMES